MAKHKHRWIKAEGGYVCSDHACTCSGEEKAAQMCRGCGHGRCKASIARRDLATPGGPVLARAIRGRAAPKEPK